MAGPQLENGYTRIANELLERIHGLPINGSEFRIMLTVIRKTYGWHKKADKISLSQFQRETGLNRANVVKAIKSLVVKRLLAKDKNVYKFNKNWHEWLVVKRLPPVVKRLLPSSQTTTKSSSQLTTHKRKKDNNTKESKSRKARLKLTDEDFIRTLKENPAYKHIDFDVELGKMDAWLSLHPNRKKTRRFVLGWLNRVEKPLPTKLPENPPDWLANPKYDSDGNIIRPEDSQ